MECRRLFTCVLVSSNLPSCTFVIASRLGLRVTCSNLVKHLHIWPHGPALLSQQYLLWCKDCSGWACTGRGQWWAVVLLWNMMLWLNTCMSLLLPEAMADISCKHTLCCMQKIAQKNDMLFLVTSINFGIHNPVPSWYYRCCRWLVQIALLLKRTSPCLLLSAPLLVLTVVNVLLWHTCMNY